MASTRSTLSVRTTAADAHGIRVFQLLVAGVMLVGAALVLLNGIYTEIELLVAGMAIAFVATGVAIGLP